MRAILAIVSHGDIFSHPLIVNPVVEFIITVISTLVRMARGSRQRNPRIDNEKSMPRFSHDFTIIYETCREIIVIAVHGSADDMVLRRRAALPLIVRQDWDPRFSRSTGHSLETEKPLSLRGRFSHDVTPMNPLALLPYPRLLCTTIAMSLVSYLTIRLTYSELAQYWRSIPGPGAELAGAGIQDRKPDFRRGVRLLICITDFTFPPYFPLRPVSLISTCTRPCMRWFYIREEMYESHRRTYNKYWFCHRSEWLFSRVDQAEAKINWSLVFPPSSLFSLHGVPYGVRLLWANI